MWWFGGIVVVGLLILSIRSESFWIDELSSAFLSSEPTWRGLVLRLGDFGSETQMPFHVAWLWLWSRFFGTGEWALRAANIPWAMVATVAWIGLLKKKGCGAWALGLLISPFICYYMNEARPYVMTLATSMLSLYAVESLCSAPQGACVGRQTLILVTGIGLCAGTSMLNLVLVPSLVVYAAMRVSGGGGFRGLMDWMRHHRGTLICLTVLLMCLTGYYLMTLVQGHGGQRDPFTWINALYAIYELLGFGGLGAPRILLRELSVASILSKYGVTLGLGLAVWIGVGWVIWIRRRDLLKDTIVRAAVISLAVGVLALSGAAIICSVSLWGRHFMVMMPLLLWGVASTLDMVRKDLPIAGHCAMLGLLGVFAVSSVRQRELEDYRKDPLREATAELVAIVHRSPHVPVVMVTAPLASWCYGGKAAPALTPVFGWPEARSRRWQREHPSYVVLVHRADKFDPKGIWTPSRTDDHVKLLWWAGNIRIYLVNGMVSEKGES